MQELIYCVEDDTNIRELVAYALKAAGFQAFGYECAEDFYEGLRNEKPALLILDCMLPDEDGITIMKKLKSSSQYAEIPIIMLTAKSTEFDKVTGLDAGADDYVTKPFGVMELISRVKAVLRRTTKITVQTRALCIGNVSVDELKHLVTVNGEVVSLTLKEFELLAYLIRNRGIVLTRDKILEVIWGYEYEGESRTVDVHIGTLRQKLGDCGEMIRTIRGVGYKMEE